MRYDEIDRLPVGTPLYWARFIPGTTPIVEIVTCRVKTMPPRAEKFAAYTDNDAKFMTAQCFEVDWLFANRSDAVEALCNRVDARIELLRELRGRLR